MSYFIKSQRQNSSWTEHYEIVGIVYKLELFIHDKFHSRPTSGSAYNIQEEKHRNTFVTSTHQSIWACTQAESTT